MPQIMFIWFHLKKTRARFRITIITIRRGSISGKKNAGMRKNLSRSNPPPLFFFLISDPDNDLTLNDYLIGNNGKTQDIADVAKQLNVDHLLPLSFVKLSNGQTRRARIAKALLKKPAMLVLDEPLSKTLSNFSKKSLV